jgi:hypothetical protein
MAHMDRIMQIELRGHGGQVVGVMVHVVPSVGLGRPAVTAPVVRDDPIAVRQTKPYRP